MEQWVFEQYGFKLEVALWPCLILLAIVAFTCGVSELRIRYDLYCWKNGKGKYKW
jgi:hypothetical protein